MRAAQELATAVGVAAACAALGIARASFYRQQATSPPAESNAHRPRSARALDDQQRQELQGVLHSERFVDKAPAEIYATLLDEGMYLCSIRTMYRILDEAHEVRERRNQLRHPQYKKPELLATGPNQVWSWDITKLLGPQKWTYYYLYVILDIFSRYAVGWMLAEQEAASLAARLIRETAHKQNVPPDQLTIHSDRGPAMKSQTVAQLLATLGVTKSHSRPYVSNDNPFSESQFKTIKYRPDFPDRFGAPQDARSFCQRFFHWYNYEHYHSGIAMLTPAMVHYHLADQVIAARQSVLDAAYTAHPQRFVNKRPTAPQLPNQVWINPPAERPNQDSTESRPNPLIETAAPSPAASHENQPPGSPLTHDLHPGRLLIPAQFAPDLNKLAPQHPTCPTDDPACPQPHNHDSQIRKHFFGPDCLHPTAEAVRAQNIWTTRYTNFVSQVSQTR
jgi:putative transposase